MRKGYKAILCIGLAIFVAGAAYAQFAKPEDAIRYRKSVMFLITQHFKSMGAVVQGKSEFEKEKVAHDAQTLKFLATLPWEAMTTPGSDTGDTTLSGAVFKKSDRFDKEVKAFEAATQDLAAVASTGDRAKVEGLFGTVAGNCKSCHGQFRKK